MTAHTPESIVEAIRPTLDQFTIAVQPYLRKASEEIYEQLLNTTQDYLRENAEWNISGEIARCRKIESENARLRIVNDGLLAVMIDMFENPQFQVAIGGNPTMVEDLMGRARASIALATQVQP